MPKTRMNMPAHERETPYDIEEDEPELEDERLARRAAYLRGVRVIHAEAIEAAEGMRTALEYELVWGDRKEMARDALSAWVNWVQGVV